MDIKVDKVGSKVIEENFNLARPNGLITKYDFIQFLTETIITLDGVDKTCTPGTCIIYSPECPQYYRNTNGWLNHDWIEFECYDPTIFEQLKIPLNKPFFTSISKSISNEIKKLYDISKTDTIFTQTELVAEFYDLLILLSKHLHAKVTSSYAMANKAFNDSLSYARLDIYQNPCNINVEQIAKKNGYTVSHFCNAYKKVFNTTIHEDLTKARLMYAENAIIDGKKPNKISKELGFSSVEYFYMWFKKLKGKTINEFRKKPNWFQAELY